MNTHHYPAQMRALNLMLILDAEDEVILNAPDLKTLHILAERNRIWASRALTLQRLAPITDKPPPLAKGAAPPAAPNVLANPAAAHPPQDDPESIFARLKASLDRNTGHIHTERARLSGRTDRGCAARADTAGGKDGGVDDRRPAGPPMPA